jgi:hypothetical protein
VLIFEQKQGTSRNSPCYKAASSLKQSVHGQCVCPSQLYILDIARGSTWTSPKTDIDLKSICDFSKSMMPFVDSISTRQGAASGNNGGDNDNDDKDNDGNDNDNDNDNDNTIMVVLLIDRKNI